MMRTLLRLRMLLMLMSQWKPALSNADDDDAKENFKTAIIIEIISKTSTLHVRHSFLYISSSPLHDDEVKLLNYALCGGREHKTTIFFFSFWTWIPMLKTSILGKLTNIWRIDLFSLGFVFPIQATRSYPRELFLSSIAFIHVRTCGTIFERQKKHSFESVTWSELGKQNLQAKKVYWGAVVVA